MSFRGSANSLVDQFVTLTQNSSASNATLASLLINQEDKYLKLKYFDTERTVTMLTIGGGTLATTGTFASLATSGTLTTAWTNISAPQLVVFSNGQQRTVNFTQNSATITWSPALTASATTAVITTQGVQSYPLPANVSKVKNDTITVGQLVYSPAPVQSIQDWTKLNALPYTSDIPAYFYIYNNRLNFWPIPSTSGNVITINCQIASGDMTYSDFTTGTLATVTQGSNLIVGSSTTWNTQFPVGVDLTFANLFITMNPPNGDGIPYQIQMFNSGTQATLTKPVVNIPGSGPTYTIGQYSLLSPDFHDAILYGALRTYYQSIVPDTNRYQMYDAKFKERQELMKFYLANKQVNVDISTTPQMTNPNLYYMGH